jgi:hypothetical protein
MIGEREQLLRVRMTRSLSNPTDQVDLVAEILRVLDPGGLA